MTTSGEYFNERIAEAISEAHDLPSSVAAVMRVVDEERRELRAALERVQSRWDDLTVTAPTVAAVAEMEHELRRLRLSVRCECPWVDGESHLDPSCLVHQRMD